MCNLRGTAPCLVRVLYRVCVLSSLHKGLTTVEHRELEAHVWCLATLYCTVKDKGGCMLACNPNRQSLLLRLRVQPCASGRLTTTIAVSAACSDLCVQPGLYSRNKQAGHAGTASCVELASLCVVELTASWEGKDL